MNITLQKEILHLRMSVKQELWLEKRLELTVKFNKIQFSKLFLVPSNAFSTCIKLAIYALFLFNLCGYLIARLNTKNEFKSLMYK